MTKSSIVLPQKIYQDIYRYLFPKRIRSQRVAFIFATISKTNDSVDFLFKSWYSVKSHEYQYRSKGYVELKDKMRQKIIKKAFDIDAAIIETHSHICSKSACFSPTDLEGFKEFVPHVWWRLNKKPYAAIVFSKSDFDAFIWVDNPQQHNRLTRIDVDGQHLYPTGLTSINLEKGYGYRTF